MHRNLICSVALFALIPVAGCQSPKADPTDTFESFDAVDQKSDAFSTHMKIVGSLDYGQTSDPVAYKSSPTYRAFKFAGDKGDKVDITVSSDDGDAVAWLLDNSFRTIAKNDDAAEGGTLDSHITTTLPANRTASIRTYYIVFREYSYAKATFTVGLKNTAANFFSCKVDSDCVKVAKACCTNLGNIAVAKGQEAAYQASLSCPATLICPKIALRDDHSMPECNGATNKCELVLPNDIACGGHVINNHACPDNYSCQGDALASDGTGKCYQFCGGIAGIGCDDPNNSCLDNPWDGCDPAKGGADCGGVCAPTCVQTQFCIQGSSWDPVRCKCVANPVCVQTQACIKGSVWDTTACKCVVKPVCVQTQLCIKGSSWDSTACKCVANIACGGFAGLPCPSGKTCVDDPTDSCDPTKGGADCIGICQ